MSPLPLGILASSGVSPAFFAYFAGGYYHGTTVDKLNFLDDSRTTLATGLSQTFAACTATFDSQVAGYVTGGDHNSTLGNKISFPTDVRSTLTFSNVVHNNTPGGWSNSGTAGYVGGGDSTRAIDKFVYATSARSTISSQLALVTRYIASTASHKGVRGFHWGGQRPSPSYYFSEYYKLEFSTDALSYAGGFIQDFLATGFANDGVASYFGGGVNSGSAIRKVTITGTGSTIGATLLASDHSQGGAAARGLHGYFAGASSSIVSASKLSFPTETRTTVSNALSVAAEAFAGFSNDASL